MWTVSKIITKSIKHEQRQRYVDMWIVRYVFWFKSFFWTYAPDPDSKCTDKPDAVTSWVVVTPGLCPVKNAVDENNQQEAKADSKISEDDMKKKLLDKMKQSDE